MASVSLACADRNEAAFHAPRWFSVSDLVMAAISLTILSSIAFCAGWLVSSRCCWQVTLGVSGAVLAALLLFVFRFHGTLQMARVVSFSGAIILANWIPIGGAYFAGVMVRERSSPWWRRGILAGLILLVSAYSVVCCFQGRLPLEPRVKSQSTWKQQSQASSCGPCSAALLLRHHGIAATEKEMLRLCLTSHRGCPALGLYRGLKIKTAQTGWDVEVVCCSYEELLEMRGPLLLRTTIQPMVRLVETEFVMERRTYQHAVLLMYVDDCGHACIIDPAVSTDWCCQRCIEDLREEWTGEALRLVRRGGR